MKNAVSICLLFLFQGALFAQNNAIYPQGEVLWNYESIYYYNNPPIYSYEDVFWTGIDTVINQNTYTTKAPNGFLRYQAQTDETFFYCNETESEYNITRPASHQIGDTIDLTDLIRLLDQCVNCYENSYVQTSAEEINAEPGLQVLGVVSLESSFPYLSYEIEPIKILNGEVIFNDTFGDLRYTPGVGVHIFWQFSWDNHILKCVFENDQTFNTFNPGCVLDLEQDNFAGFSLFPNPAESEIRIELDNSNQEQVQVTIYDLLGKEIYVNNAYLSGQAISLSQCGPGVYSVRVELNQKQYFSKLIVE